MDFQDWAQQTAAEVMTTRLVTLTPVQTVSEAAQILLHEQISGAPVIADNGECVGVFSVTDIPQAEQKTEACRRAVEHSAFWNSDLPHPLGLHRDQPIPAGNLPVSNFMTRDLVTVAPETPLSTVIHHLVEAHVHRVLVMDSQARLRGIISVQDILAAVLRELAVA